MAIAVFKNKTFQVSSKKVYTFDGLTWGGDIQAEAQDKLNSKPSTYIKGIGLNNMSFEISLKSSLGINVRSEIEQWEAIKNSLQAAIFILGTKPLGPNKWLLKSTNTSDILINNKGELIQATIKLDFEEFIRPGSAEASEASKSSKSKSATKSKSKAAVNTNIAPSNYIYKPPTKTQQTRNNTNVTSSISTGSKTRNTSRA